MSFGDGNLHAQVAQLKTENARLKQRVRELESLVLDAERLLTMWDKAEWNCTPDEYKTGDYEPEGNLRVLQERIAGLGKLGDLEARAR